MAFIDGYLALCSAVTAAGVTELAVPGYARQPIAFSDPVVGVSLNLNAWTFGMTVRGALGRAIYDAPTGGNLLLAWAHPQPTASGRLPWDGGQAGDLRLTFAAMTPFARGAAYTGRVAAGAAVGTGNDCFDVVNRQDLGQSLGNPALLVNTSPLYAGCALSIARGILQAGAAVPAGTE